MAVSSTGLRSKLSSDLVEIDCEVKSIDEEIRRLRRRKQDLLTKKSQMEERLNANSSNDGSAEDQWDNDKFSWSARASEILREVFHMPSFRPLQQAAINAVMSGEDTIIVMSTGGGKSLCYQLPAVLSQGLTVVVSPLISLVEDQLTQLRKLGVEAATLNQNTSKYEVKRIEAEITNKESGFRLLYVTPEKLAKSKRIMNKLEKSLSVGFLKLIAIDEVHCCSQWGHDFRTDYNFLNVLKRQFKGVPILGLTATATGRILDDVKDMLGIRGAIVFRSGFNRSNLRYEVKQKSSNDVLDIANLINKRFPKQSGIVYCFSRKDCEEVAKQLKLNGIAAAHYHAYLESDRRSVVHEKWLLGQIQVIVATVAFGMGIDKPNVRFVIHHAIPKSVENYYQESGRAGRDGETATCLLYFRFADIFRQSTMVCTEKTGLNNLYEMVRFATDISVCRRVRLAEHFEEEWEVSWCQGACDVCSNTCESRESDVSSFMENAAEIIRQSEVSAKEGSGRITAGKLAELLAKRTRANKEEVEKIVCHLLLQGYLSEDFHFTPYSIISYIQVAPKWRMNGQQKILMDVLSGSVSAPSAPKKRKVLVESEGEEAEVD